MNKGFCPSCNQLVEAKSAERDGKIYLVKTCPTHGVSETLISGDAARYKVKRQIDVPFDYGACELNCLDCHHKKPNLIFVDITNRCNLNCPICINNTPSMGFLFEPPLDYFDKIFKHFGAYNPKPSVQLFGGEPTVRADLFDIIRMAKGYGLATRVVTNGIKLADEEYCRKLVETRATINISYDGANPENYRILRGSAKCLELKQKAIANIARIGGAKVIFMTLAAKGFNDQELPALFAYCHELRHAVRAVYFMPLAHTWKKGRFGLPQGAAREGEAPAEPRPVPGTAREDPRPPSDAERRGCSGSVPSQSGGTRLGESGGPGADFEPERITSEDVEGIVQAAFPEDRVEFIPAGFLGQLKGLMDSLKIKPLPFLGAHPNCESMYVLVSDGEKFVPLGRFLRKPLPEVAQALIELNERLARRMARMQKGLWGRFLGAIGLRDKAIRLRGMLAVLGLLRRHGRIGDVLKGKSRVGKAYHALRIPLDLVFGRRTQKTMDAHTTVHGFFQVVVLPFEDRYMLETERMERCPTSFAFYDPEAGEVKYVPVCAWGIHKTTVMRKVAEHYAGKAEPKSNLQ